MRYSRFLLLLIIAVVLVVSGSLRQIRQEPTERTFQIEASSFEFSPAEIYVNPGDHVTIELTSLDVVHGLYLDGYGLQVEADPGQTQTLSFTADRSGTFRFRCSVTCGDLHPFMIGKFQVGKNLLFIRGVVLAVLITLGLILISSGRFQTKHTVDEG